ncbi:MAG: glycosyltransferase, partial [Mesorhizobium sp.]
MAKRIVFHIASLRGGGAERVFVLMANELASRGHDVTLFTWNAEGPNAALRSPAVHLVDFDLPIRGEGYGKWETLKGIVRSARLFSRLGPHAVYSAPEFANLVVALALLLARSRARFFPSFHAAASLPSSSLGARIAVWLSALVAARATKAIAVSVGVGRDIAARGFPKSKVVVINNPLPPAAALQQDSYTWQTKLATMGDGPVIATAGRLVPVKDHRTLLQAFAILRAGRRARLVIFGEGPLAAELRTYAQESGIAADVLFAGYVND